MLTLQDFIQHQLVVDDTTRYQVAKDLGISTATVLGWHNGSKTKCFRSLKARIEAKYDVELDASVIARHKRGVSC